MKTLPTSLKNKLLPLLLTLAVNQAYAAGIVYTGIDGASGLIGTAPGQHGGAGVPLSAALGQAQAALTLTLYGGVGGQGRSANGAIATSTSAALDTVVAALFYGGRGGVGGAAGGLAEMTDNGDIWGPFNPIYGASGVGGNGGVATSWASATVGSAASVSVGALAVGGSTHGTPTARRARRPRPSTSCAAAAAVPARRPGAAIPGGGDGQRRRRPWRGAGERCGRPDAGGVAGQHPVQRNQ